MLKLLILLLPIYSFAQSSLTVVAVGEAEVVSEKIVIEKAYVEKEVTSAQQEALENDIDIIRNDLRFYKKYFNVVQRSIPRNSFETFNNSHYLPREINHVVRLNLETSGGASILRYALYNVASSKKVFEKSIRYVPKERRLMHQIANDVFQRIVGKEPVFLHRIVFVSDKGRKHGAKELYMMDFDGANVKQLTRHEGLVISPAVSPDGKKIVYSLINEKKGGRKNINLRLMDLEKKTSTILSKRQGINSGAVFSSDGKYLYLTLSHQGNAEIYKMELATKQLLRLTNNYAPDVDPSVTANGDLMTFLSGRPGKAMIYTMVPTKEENQVKRISYVGKFNATPRFSPDGREIVFSSWLDNRFDLFRINSDGSGLGRLTKDFGSNEDPDYSKDGQFIIFTSQRVISIKKAVQNVYIMDRNGDILGSLTKNFGNCISPRWLK